MYKSILQFIEKDTKEIEELIKLMLSGEKDSADLSNEIKERVLNLGNNLIADIYETIDDEIKACVERKKHWTVNKCYQEKEILDVMGTVRFKRTGYKDKKTGKYIYLLDQVLGLESHQRISLGAAANILEEAIDTSYRKGGVSASSTEIASKQAVKRLVHNTIIEMPLPKEKEKRKVKKLYIVADEDHVSAQFWQEKGDLPLDSRGYKVNTIMPKLICVYENIINESGKQSKNPRYKLIGKHYFCGVYKGEQENIKFWEKVSDYIETVYDTDILEAVYISGDGAPWIKTGCEIINKSHFILDKFHMMKYINKSVTHLLDSAEDVKGEIWEALNTGNKKELKLIYNKIISVTEKENKIKEVEKALGYFLNHWNGLKIRVNNPDDTFRCCAEGQVSHILSSRLSSRPMGWSVLGCHQMSMLRAYKANNRKVIDLLRYQKSNQMLKEKREEQDALIKELRKRKSNTEVYDGLRGEIPGLGGRQLYWMRDLINGAIGIA